MDAFWNSFLTPVLSFMTSFYSEIMFAQLLFVLVFGKRKYFYIPLLCWVALDIGFFFIPNFYSSQGPLTVGGWFNFSFLLCLIFSSLFFFLTSRISFKEVLFYTSSAYAVQNLSHNLTLLIISEAGFTYRVKYALLIELGIMAVLYTIFYFVFVVRIKKGKDTAVNNIYVILISFGTFLLTYVMSMLLLPSNTNNAIALIYASLCCFFLLSIQFFFFDKSRMQREKETFERLYNSEKRQYDQWKTNIDVINIKCHDLKNQISSLRSLDDSETKEKSLTEIEKSIMLYDQVAKTGNETLDVVLTEKSLYCEKNNIKLSYIVDAPNLSLLKMEDMDICSLFGNALDNAIEEEIKIPDLEKRIISLKVFSKGEMLYLHFDNYCQKDVAIKDGLPITTKEDKRFHGFGLRSMEMIAEKYHGRMLVSSKSNVFSLDFWFPLKND